MWGGRPPTLRLREVGGNVLGVARSDRDRLRGRAAPFEAAGLIVVNPFDEAQ